MNQDDEEVLEEEVLDLEEPVPENDEVPEAEVEAEALPAREDDLDVEEGAQTV